MNNILDISICIACYPPHITILNNLLDSINNSSFYPKECIIGLSETYIYDSNKLEETLNKKYNYKIIITSNEKKCNQAQNRNRAFNLATSKYITVNDADDIVHYDRLKIIYNILEKEQYISLIHSYHLADDNDKKRINISNKWIIPDENKYNKLVKYTEELYNMMLETDGKHIHLPLGCCHGYITFKTEILKFLKQDEVNLTDKYPFTVNDFNTDKNKDHGKQYGEDSKFIRDILKFYKNNNKTMVYYNIPLMKYFN